MGKTLQGLVLALTLLAFGVGLKGVSAAAFGEEPPQAFPEVHYEFGKQIRFSVRFRPATNIRQVTLFYHPANEPYTLTAKMGWDAKKGEAFFVHDLRKRPFVPFTKVFYWFRLETQDGGSFTTPSFSFLLADNRFQWRHAIAPPFEVFWYQGNLAIAQQTLNAGIEGLLRSQEIWLAPTPKHVNIYIYADAQALQSALGTEPWVAAHASPRLGALFISLPPAGKESEIRRLVPHELAHYLLYQQVGELGYRSLPVWLNEGLASLAELAPLPDYKLVLQQAAESNNLIPIRHLCRGFPRAAGAALLAYAESASFTGYLSHRYGRVAMHHLVDAYAQGMDCDEGARRVLGRGLTALEADWRHNTLGISPWSSALRGLSPWFLLFILLLAGLLLGAQVARL